MAYFGLPNAANLALRRTLYRLVVIQAGLLAVAVIWLILAKGINFGLAALYGGAASIAGTLVSGWRLKVATDDSAGMQNTLQVEIAEFYKAWIFRFVLIIALLALGMGILDMEALGILIGFIAAQLGYFFARPQRAR